MNVLVTGASSLIGEGVVRSLVGRGDQVVCFQRRHVASLDRLPPGAGLVDQRLGDIREAADVADAAEGCDAIVHLAARVGVVGTADDFMSVNVGGTHNVLAAARQHGIERVVQVSSPSVAHGGEAITGSGADTPETGRARAWYAESKAIAEIDALQAASESMGVVAVRPHLVWGPGDPQLVGRIVQRASEGRLALVGGGHAMVDTTYIDNAVDALVAALDRVSPSSACSGRAYVIANGEPRPIRDLVAGICAAAGVPYAPRDVPLRAARSLGSVVERVWPLLPHRLRDADPEPPLTRFTAEQLGTAHWFDPRPAAEDLGWTPRVGIDEGLARLERWFVEHKH